MEERKGIIEILYKQQKNWRLVMVAVEGNSDNVAEMGFKTYI